MVTMQVEYRFHDEGHWWFGRDRLSHGVMVGNKDFKESLKQVKRQLKESIQGADASGTPVCTQSDEELEKHLAVAGRAMTMWTIDNFSF